MNQTILSVIEIVMSFNTHSAYSNVQEDIPDNINMRPFVKVGKKYYYFGQSKVTWYNAYTICRTMGGLLASYETAQELAELSKYLISKYSTKFNSWLAASDQDTEGQWIWYNNGETITYAEWAPGQPDNWNGNENCAHLLSRDGRYLLNDVHCGLRNYYICEADKPKMASIVLCAIKLVISFRTTDISTHILEDIPDNIEIKPFVKVGEKYFYFGESKVSWYNAFRICRYMGSHLASYESAQELSELSNYLIKRYSKNFNTWLSGSDLDSEGLWIWYNTGEVMIYADWFEGQPDNFMGIEHCAHLLSIGSKYRMNDEDCKSRRNYICQADKPETIAIQRKMWQNLCHIGLVLCAIKIVVSYRTHGVFTTQLEDFNDYQDMRPYVKVGKKFYYFGQNKVTWYNALLSCHTMGGFLASFDSAEELAQLSNYLTMKYSTTFNCWLSASDEDVEGLWIWYKTGEPIAYADWYDGQPDNFMGLEHCAHLFSAGGKYRMNDEDCKSLMFYICEADKTKTVAVSIF
ncbi:C-type lectin 37Da [Lucilia cuprina]|nr:C-type lectin 37Da [Lucilia cuprina]